MNYAAAILFLIVCLVGLAIYSSHQEAVATREGLQTKCRAAGGALVLSLYSASNGRDYICIEGKVLFRGTGAVL